MKDLVNDRNGQVLAVFLMPHPPVILTEIGEGREIDASKTIEACQKTASLVASLEPDTIVIISPHTPRFSNWVFSYDSSILSGTFARFGKPELSVTASQDSEYLSVCIETLQAQGFPAGWPGHELMDRMDNGSSLDHGVMVPLYWLQKACPSASVVAIAPASGNSQRVWASGVALAQAARITGRRVCLIASGDLSHKVTAESPYGMVPQGAAFDQQVSQAFQNGKIPDLLGIEHDFREAAAECGLDSLLMAAGALWSDHGAVPSDSLPRGFSSRLFSYEAPFGIGYCVGAILPDSIVASETEFVRESLNTPNCESAPVRIARMTIESFVKTGNVQDVSTLPDLATDKKFPLQSGCFVSLKKHGDLRGCIGTITPTRINLVEEICRNAVAACSQDPRFEPVSKNELGLLKISVDILSPAEPITSKKELDPAKYGVIVTSGFRRGLLLPDLAGVDTVDDQLDIACSKAGIGPGESFEMERFLVTRYT